MENFEEQTKQPELNNKKPKTSFITIVLIVLLVIAVVYIIADAYSDSKFISSISNVLPFKPISNVLKKKTSDVKIKKFESEQEFKNYLQEAGDNSQYAMYGLGAGMRDVTMELTEESMAMKGMVESIPSTQEIGDTEVLSPERVSETNVQVLGIDEPDIVKTDGQDIYFSLSRYYRYRTFGIPKPDSYSKTKIIKAFPPADLKEIADVEKSGDLLLYEDTLIIFSGQNIYGYDVSDSKNPEKKWDIKLEDNNYLVEARLYKGDIYLVTRSRINTYHPCPIRPLTIGETAVEIKCVDIYYPNIPIEVDSTFIAMRINTKLGEIEDKTSFIGSSNSSVVYMSENALYITYFYNKSTVEFFYNFLSEKCSDLVSNLLISKLGALNDYEISNQAKVTEMQVLLEQYYASLDNDERLRIENEFSNRMSDYHKEHIRELEKTGIVKIDLDNFKIDASGEVPGYPLNQFALDEYDEHLRIAVTIGERNMFGFGFGRGQSINDVYILDENLKEKGSVKNLGETERVYSVRFVNEMAYVVTFRQTDPFYVLDLSNPSNPELKGELKIPGYSSYLHPLTKDSLLGIGKEGSKVKLSLFNISNPSDPKEVNKYMIDEYWSEAVNNHHAFLLDKKHKVFFMPGGKGAYIFSYDNNKLDMTKSLSKTGVKRAIYIDDYLYIISDTDITVINEIDWEEVNDLDFE